MRHDFPWTIERDEETFEIEIEGTYRFGDPAFWPDPPDPDEFEITAILFDGKPFEITDAEETSIRDWAYDNPPDDDDYPEYD